VDIKVSFKLLNVNAIDILELPQYFLLISMLCRVGLEFSGLTGDKSRKMGILVVEFLQNEF
jgi:hypothetical protein